MPTIEEVEQKIIELGLRRARLADNKDYRGAQKAQEERDSWILIYRQMMRNAREHESAHKPD